MGGSRDNVWGRAALLGALSGLRSTAGLVGLSYGGAYGDLPGLRITRFGFLASRGGVIGTIAALVGELVVDKLPQTPARIKLQPLVGRAMLGGIAGAAVCAANDESLPSGFVVGAVAALGTSYAGYFARRALTHIYGLPDLPVALGEDALVLLGLSTVRRPKLGYEER